MRLKIISDGTQEGTKVIDSKTGEELEDVLEVHYEVTECGVEAVVILECVAAEIESDFDIEEDLA